MQKIFLSLVMLISITACTSAVVGGAAVGGYSLAENKDSVVKYTSDTVITSKVKAKFLANKDLKSLNISVMTQDGNVVLTGSVPTKAMRVNAIMIAQNTEGVKSVNVLNLRVTN